ncbi:MAG: iron ABC transporter permease [Desulfobacterales bacterium]|nr:iron ABC transporter permease [Desulfobacterales bacterium]
MTPSKAFILGLSLVLFALIALAPPGMLLLNLFSFSPKISIWKWLLERQVHLLTLHSLNMALVATVTALALGLPVGLALGSKRKPLLFGIIFFLPLAIPPYLTASCWMGLLGRGGILPHLAHEWLGMDARSSWLGGAWGAGIVLGLSYFPVLTYMVISGMRRLDAHLEEAAMFALPENGILRKITLPLLFPQIGTGLLLVFLLAITNYAVPSLLGIRTFTVKIYTYFSVFQDIGGAVLLSLPLLLICLVCVLLLHHIMKGRVFFSLQQGEEMGGSLLRLLNSKLFKILACGPALFVTCTPILFLLFQTGSFLSLKIAVDQAKESILTSFVLALFASFCISIVAFVSGYALERTKWGKGGVTRSLFFFPFALPSVLLSIGVIFFWNRPGIVLVYQSLLIITILWGAKYLPLAQRVLADHIRQIPLEMEEIAFLSQLSWTKSLCRIVWPLARPGFLVAWAVTYIFCLSELGGTLLVIPPGADTMPVRLYNIMHYGSSSLLAALGLVLIMMTIIPMGLLVWCGKGIKGLRD